MTIDKTIGLLTHSPVCITIRMLLPSRRQLVPRGVYPPRCSVHLNDRRNSYEVSDLFVRDLGLLEPRGVETPVFSAWALGGGPVTPVDPVVLW